MRSDVRRARCRTLRHRTLQLILLASSALIVGRALQLQVLEADDWRQKALSQHERRDVLPAPRGNIYDRDGRELAVSRTTYELGVDPRALSDRQAAAGVLRSVLSLSPRTERAIADGRRSWVHIPGKHSAIVREELQGRLGEKGLVFTPVVERFYPRGTLAAELLGRVDVSGKGASGIELSFDSLLTGQPGFAVRRRDATGASAGWLTTPIVEPSAGSDIYLTIDAELQSLAESILEEAIVQSGASGGDLLIVEPESGELLAATSRRRGRVLHLAAATEPYEPGSTVKPFTAAALISDGYATLDDEIDTGLGSYETAGRVIHDTRPHGRLTLAEVLEVSSNVGIAKFAERLPRGAQYSYLRGFGFGTPTGLTYPSESAGLLRPPGEWSRQSSASLAIGYELAVTPLQLAMAYSAIANGGVLMGPLLVKRAVTARQVERWRREPRVVRRVISESTAAKLRDVLSYAVSQGTGRTAGVRGLSVAGKTGTALRFSSTGGYTGESYTASFVGLVPSDEPELVVLVKLDAPSGEYYGAQTAAPVMRTAVRAALAGSHWSAPPLLGEPDYPDQKAGVSAGRASAGGPYIFALDAPIERTGEGSGRFDRHAARVVPDLEDLSIRAAAHRLHEEGWRVVVQGGGRVESMQPAAGSVLRSGERIVLTGDRRAPPGTAKRREAG